MPNVICPHCVAPTVLPDPWPHPGYTCPRCGATVPLVPPAAAAPAPPAPDALDFTADEPSRSRRARRPDPGSTGFAFGFGQELGRSAAQLLTGCVVFAILAAVIGGALVMHFSGR